MPLNKKLVETWAWWAGSPLIIALLTAGPYWIRALVLGRADWLRIPVVGDAVFDTAAYLQPIGHAAIGIPEAALIGPFAALVSWLATIAPGASVAELWLITRWLTTLLALWTGAWAVRSWSGLPVRASRLISAMLWVSVVLVLGMKPGVFSWFLPMGFFGFAAVPLVADALERRRFVRAIIWSALIAIITSVYAWYQIFIMVWLSVVWFEWFGRRSWKLLAAWMAVAGAAASTIAVMAGIWIARTEQGTVLLQLYERLSLSPTHMPFVSGSVLLTGLWIVLLIPVARRAVGRATQLASYAVAAWIALLLCFLHSPFTGHYIQNDHFRAPAVIASWLTLALVWNLTRSAEVRPRPPSRVTRRLLNTLLAISGLLTLRILAAPYAWNRDILNVVHLTHWFAFVFTAVLVVRWMNGKRPATPTAFAATLTIAALITGGVAWWYVLTQEFAGMTRVEKLQPLWTWVQRNVPADQSVCTDHGGDLLSLDDQLSAITGRVVHMAHTTLYHRERHEAFLTRMRTMAGFYNVRDAGDEGYWELQATLNQFIVCDQFPWQRKLFSTLGLSKEQADTLITCPRAQIGAWWAPIQEQINNPVPNERAFKHMCPYVVIPDRTKPFWNLPADYQETRVMDGVSVWSLTSAP
jgi:hypothetical protein